MLVQQSNRYFSNVYDITIPGTSSKCTLLGTIYLLIYVPPVQLGTHLFLVYVQYDHKSINKYLLTIERTPIIANLVALHNPINLLP